MHRDLKSFNVVVTAEGEVKVLDFGIARQVERDEEGTFENSAAYPPGVFTVRLVNGSGSPGWQPADARADVWALGVILQEMASGELPFTGPTPLEFASAILKESPAPLPARVPPMLRNRSSMLGQRTRTTIPMRRQVRAALETAASAPMGVPVAHRRSLRRRVGWMMARLLLPSSWLQPRCISTAAAGHLDRSSDSFGRRAPTGEPLR